MPYNVHLPPRARLTSCSCLRCCSSSELESFCSALCCLACDEGEEEDHEDQEEEGFFLPPAADSGEEDYKCEVCLNTLPGYVAASTSEELRPIVSEYGMFTLQEQEDFLECLLTKFHPQVCSSS